jgi:hypothetical protein
MADAVFDAMGEVLARWTMGSTAAPAASIWKNELGTEPEEAELRLLALSGQFFGVAVTTAPSAELRALPDVPALAMPTVPDTLRPLVRRLLAAKLKAQLLRFIALRGWTVHPADWMPDANDEGVPDVYAPWRDWAAVATSSLPMQGATNDRITPENWADWLPAARKVAVIELRRSDPAAARVLLEATLPGENADVRLRLLEILERRLSEDDVPFLESLVATDRAPKVKALAASLLSRMNRGSVDSTDDLAELRGFFLVKTKGLLRRSRVIEFGNAKTPAQRHRRTFLFENIDFSTLSTALGIAAPDLIAIWPWRTDKEADEALVALIARSEPSALVMQAAEAMSKGDIGLYHLQPKLLQRLTAAQRTALAEIELRRPHRRFELALSITGGAALLENPLGTASGADLLRLLGQSDAKATDWVDQLNALGLVTAHGWARRVMDRLNAAGIMQGDPRLDMLRLNEALEDRGVTS